ncbi:hypothetical protein ACJJTC_016905 [Scirpophaga incertulas]
MKNTDGISIISDSEAEPLEQSKSDRTDQNSENQHFISLNSELENTDFLNNMNKDFPENTNSSLKTYVHRRNKRLSTVLNIIVLGSVVTAAGVAIGHIWGETEYSTKKYDSNISNNDITKNYQKDNKNEEKNNCYQKLEENLNKQDSLKDEVTESEVTWYDKRAYIRNEARKKLEYEMFGSTNMSNAGWYFRRMRHREQCRAKDTTYKKIKQ